jgi:hypothetical protein
VDGADRVTILYRSQENGNRLAARTLFPPDYSFIGSQQQVLIDEDLGYYEPVMDRRSWRERGELAIFVQRCDQQTGSDGAVDFEIARARLQVWRAFAPYS